MKKEKMALVFPGSGNQFTGMGKELYDNFEIARQTFEEAGDAVGFDVAKLCFEGKLRELNKLRNTLSALMTVSVAMFRVYMQEYAVKPDYATGHSLGEYSALACSGFMSFSDLLKVVQLRSTIAEEVAEKENASMTIVNGLSIQKIDEIIGSFDQEKEKVYAACYNAPDQVMIAGEDNALYELEDKILAANGHIINLIGTAPFHTPLMNQMCGTLKEELEKYQTFPLQWPVISNVTGKPYQGEDTIIDALLLQLTRPVQWKSIIEYLEAQNVTFVLELGARPVLKDLFAAAARNINACSFDDTREREELAKKLARIEQARKDYEVFRYQNVLGRALTIALSVKNKNSNAQQYKNEVVKPFETILHVYQDLQKNKTKPTVEQMTEALRMLQSVMAAKGANENERQQRVNQVLMETGTNDILAGKISF